MYGLVRFSSFVYETSVANELRLRQSLKGELTSAIKERVRIDDTDALDAVMARVAAGDKLAIVAPGVDEEGHVCLGSGE